MAGVLEQIWRPRRQLVGRNVPMSGINPKILQLQAAKEILAEVFGIKTSDVEDMLKQRYEEEMEWPREFRI